MLRFIVQRLISSILILFVITVVAFTIIQIPPGDFAEVYKAELIALGGQSEEQAEEAANKLRDKYGLLDPLPIQYLKWIGAIVLHGDFGWSFSQRVDVSQLLAQRLPRTVGIALAAHAISSLVGIIAGIYIANRQYSIADNLAATFAFLATSVPRFSLALIIVYFLAFGLNWEHVSALHSPEFRYADWSIEKAIDLLKHVGPVILIAGLGGVARNMRVMRGNLLDVLNQQYVTTARSKGLEERRVINRHAVPNALHPIIAYQGTVLPYMFQGELEAAIVFGIPTMAPMFVEALLKEDVFLSGSIMLLYGILLIAGNFIADMLLGVLDPRISFS
ncbi:MAG: ABC transporter permease [Chloroflexota bacterium]|nr:ABC transporter permease [Chloroflexota bacterium]MDE2910591.1 ABC transporter permease [Chloroflexota bacterium]